jgi:hypothetical protein
MKRSEETPEYCGQRRSRHPQSASDLPSGQPLLAQPDDLADPNLGIRPAFPSSRLRARSATSSMLKRHTRRTVALAQAWSVAEVLLGEHCVMLQKGF